MISEKRSLPQNSWSKTFVAIRLSAPDLRNTCELQKKGLHLVLFGTWSIVGPCEFLPQAPKTRNPPLLTLTHFIPSGIRCSPASASLV